MFNIIFCFIVMYVRSLNYISAAINMFKLKMKRGSGVWYISSINTVRKIAAAEVSWLMLSSTLLFHLQNYHCVVPSTWFTLQSRTCEVRTTEDASPKFTYLVLRNARRPDVTSPDYLPNLLGSLDRDGNADSNRSGGKKRFLRKKFLGHIVPGNFGGKASPCNSSDSSIAPSSGLLLIQPQLLQLIMERSSGYCESCWGH